jgi:hypothetical protein
MEIKLGDVVRLKKKHPCGSDEWQVVRLGADIGIRCLKCQRRVPEVSNSPPHFAYQASLYSP